MKINFSALFTTPLDRFDTFFIFGNDSSIFHRAISYIQKKRDGSLSLKSEVDILGSVQEPPSLFASQVPTQRITLVTNVSDKVINNLPSQEGLTYIFTSDKARAKSKLVTHFSQCPRSLAISFYDSPISTSEFAFLVGERSVPEGLQRLLHKAYQNDYIGLCSALDKIELFGEVSENQYSFFLTPSEADDESSQLVRGLLMKNPKLILPQLSVLNSSNVVLFLRSVNRTFQSLYALLPFQRKIASIPWNRISPPIFFKEQSVFEQALHKWQPKEIKQLLQLLLKMESQHKYSMISLSELQQNLLRFCL